MKSWVYLSAVAVSLVIALVALVLAVDAHISIEILNQVGVGMHSDDVRERLGQPSRVTMKGEALDPPHVSGFTPSARVRNEVWLYIKYRYLIYVYIDEDNLVQVVYVCGP